MQSNNITVHHATDSDIEEVAILFNAYREFYGKDTDLSLAKNFIHERIVEHESTILVARIQDKCVGVRSALSLLFICECKTSLRVERSLCRPRPQKERCCNLSHGICGFVCEKIKLWGAHS